MKYLSSQQLNQYENEGYVAPIDILSLEEVRKIKMEIKRLILMISKA